MSQSYLADAEFDISHHLRPRRRSRPTTAAYYDQMGPYRYHEQRAEYPDHRRTVIHEPGIQGSKPSPRRRVTVACERCRKRKIRCSGEPGDGSACYACRASGLENTDEDGEICHFDRMSSHRLGVRKLPPATNAHIGQPPDAMEPSPYATAMSLGRNGPDGYGGQGTPSIPTLHTRGIPQGPTDFTPTYDASPIDNYGYSIPSNPLYAIPRMDSFSSAYALENYRSWNSSGGCMSSSTAACVEPTAAYTFGTMIAPPAPQNYHQNGRVASVTGESSSPSMSHLNSSLPMQAAQERRLPIPAPNTLQQNQHFNPATTLLASDVPEIRPLNSYPGCQGHINGIHSLKALPWTGDIEPCTSAGGGSGSTMAAPSVSYPQTTTTASSEPVLGYQFSDDVSPTSGHTLPVPGSSGSSSTMLPPARVHLPSQRSSCGTKRKERSSSISMEDQQAQISRSSLPLMTSTFRSENSATQAGGDPQRSTGDYSYALPFGRYRDRTDSSRMMQETLYSFSGENSELQQQQQTERSPIAYP